MNRDSGKTGFTLVELLVVITIIGILIALLLPAVQAAREAARRMQCQNNLKQIGLAMHNYEANFGSLPFGGSGPPNNTSAYLPLPTWAAMILPFLEQQGVYDLFDFRKDMVDPVNAKATSAIISAYICPTDGSPEKAKEGPWGDPNNSPQNSIRQWYPMSMGPTRDGTTSSDSCVYCPPGPGSYCCKGFNFGSSHPIGNFVGLFGRSQRSIKFNEITDGLSNTLMGGETIPEHCPDWNGAYSRNFPVAGTSVPLNTMETQTAFSYTGYFRACSYKSRHSGGGNFVIADGSVHFLNETIDYKLYNLLGDREDGIPAQIP